jgi:hypothetical protein
MPIRNTKLTWEKNKKEILLRLLLSLCLLSGSLFCFIFMPPSQTTTRSVKTTISPLVEHTATVEIQFQGISKYLEWLGLGLLVLALWLWRDNLGIDTLGFLGGKELSVSQQRAGRQQKPPDDSGPPPKLDITTASDMMKDLKTRQYAEQIIQLFQSVHSISAGYVWRTLKIPIETTKNILYLLTKDGQLRVDGFPEHTIYTPANSFENLILDAARNKLAGSHDIVSERRYIRVKGQYEIDSLIKCEDITFIVESKILRNEDFVGSLREWIFRLIHLTNMFPLENKAAVLAIGCSNNVRTAFVIDKLSKITFDTGSLRLLTMVFAESDLKKSSAQIPIDASV